MFGWKIHSPQRVYHGSYNSRFSKRYNVSMLFPWYLAENSPSGRDYWESAIDELEMFKPRRTTERAAKDANDIQEGDFQRSSSSTQSYQRRSFRRQSACGLTEATESRTGLSSRRTTGSAADIIFPENINSTECAGLGSGREDGRQWTNATAMARESSASPRFSV